MAGAAQEAVEGKIAGLPRARFIFFADLSGTINWGDGTVEPASLVAGFNGGIFTNTQVYADNGTYTVNITMTDGLETTIEDGVQYVAANAAAVIESSNGQQIDEGTRFDLTANFADPDTHAYETKAMPLTPRAASLTGSRSITVLRMDTVVAMRRPQTS